jgi:hypothetical protein
MFLTAYTVVHTVISLVGIVSGFVVLFGLLTAKRLDGWTSVFLATTVATSVTGFGFPVDRFLPSHAVASSRWSCSAWPSSRATAAVSPEPGGRSTWSPRSWPSTSMSLSGSCRRFGESLR